MGTTWQEWQLFLDESGRVDGIEQSVVAGVLVPHARSVAWDRTLRQGLLRRFPSMPYPMHAATLAYPISRVVGCLLSPEPTTPEERDVHERCRALRALRRAPAHVAEPFFAMIAAGSRLSHQVLGVANGWLHRAHRYEAATLDALAHEQDRALAQLLRATLAADGCAVIGAAHLPRVDGAPAGRRLTTTCPSPRLSSSVFVRCSAARRRRQFGSGSGRSVATCQTSPRDDGPPALPAPCDCRVGERGVSLPSREQRLDRLRPRPSGG